MYSFGAFGQEHTEDHAAGPLMGGPSDSLQNPPLWGTLPVTNGPTESLNNLIKRIKRVGFGFRNFRNYRIRALLYAGKPNWRVLGSIVVR